MNDKMDDKYKTYMSTCTTMAPVKVHYQPMIYIETWSLSLDGNKLTCIDQNTLYNSLYGKRTLKYWHKKGNVSCNPADIMWEEYRLARQRSTMGLCRLDYKLLCNQCGLTKTL